MSHEPSADEIARWHRWFAAEMHNRTWTLAETRERTPAEDEEMLLSAHAAALHWGQVGTALNKNRAAMLLGHVLALCGNGAQAMLFARRSCDYIMSHESPDWEIAFAHAVLANAARAAGDAALYSEQYALAKSCGEAIADPEEKEIFERSFNLLPVP
jgi:hypothetical protein